MEKLKNKPFVLLGVNSDPKNKLRDAVERENITWRSWWDGGTTQGPIAQQYGVTGWPTILLIDHKGVVRNRNLRGDALEKALDALLADVE